MTRPVFPPLNRAVKAMARIACAEGFDVSPTAPDTYRKLVRSMAKKGARLCVFDGASRGTIYAKPAINHAFRAWHDTVHLRQELDFTPESESAVAQIQCADLRAHRIACGLKSDDYLKIAQALILCEIDGQAAHYKAHNDFPKDQRKCTVDYLEKAFPYEAGLLEKYYRDQKSHRNFKNSIFRTVDVGKGRGYLASRAEFTIFKPHMERGKVRFVVLVSGAGDLDHSQAFSLTKEQLQKIAKAFAGASFSPLRAEKEEEGA